MAGVLMASMVLTSMVLKAYMAWASRNLLTSLSCT